MAVATDDADYTDTNLAVGGRYHWLPNVSTGLTLNVNGNGGSSGTAAWLAATPL